MLISVANTSNEFPGSLEIAPIEIDGATGFSVSGSVVTFTIFGSATIDGKTNLIISGFAANAGAIILSGKTEIAVSGFVKLALSIPEPILNELPVGAFAKHYYAARLFDGDGNTIRFSSATIERPKGQIGTRISIRVAKKDLSLITGDKTYTFQIGTRETPTGAVVTWQTIIEDGELDSRSFQLGWGNNAPADSLEFGTIEPLANKLNRHPTQTEIYYHRGRTEVDPSDVETTKTTTGAAFSVQAIGINNLTLYRILDKVKSALKFDAIITNIPNFEVTRIDFSYRNSYLQSVAGLIGVFEPIFFCVENTLYILDKTAAIPPEFTPQAVTAAQFSGWQIQTAENPFIDGFEISYIDDSSQADAYLERSEETLSETGTFGEANYTRTTTTRTFRDWFHTDAPEQILRTDFIRELREIHKPIPPLLLSLTKVGEETENHIYDAQGTRASTEKEIYGFAPDLNNSQIHSLLLTDSEVQNVFYKTDPRNARRKIQYKTETITSGLIAIDGENPYFDESGDETPFRQDFRRAHEAGNLKTGMTTEFGVIKTVVETIVPFGQNQYQVVQEGVDHVRNQPFRTISEPRSGDLSINAIGGRSRQIVVLRDGIFLSGRGNFGGVESLNVGELPLQFAVRLAERKLANRRARKQSGSITIIGYSPDLDRGTFFRVFDRENNSYGKFLTEGLRVDIQALGDGVQIQTAAEVSEI